MVLAAEVLHALWIHLEELRRGRLFAPSAAQRGVQVSDFNFFHFGVEVHALLGNEDGFLAAGAVMKQMLGQMLRSDDVAGDHDHEALDYVFEFADVARPGVVLEDFEDFGLKTLEGLFGGGGIDAQEVVNQEREVAVAFAERRNQDGDDVDAEVEIFAETALADGVFEILVGCGDQAKIDFASGAAAEALDGTLLENAQEFALEIGIERGDFVEKERPVMGGFNHAGLGGIGAGEGALFVTEKFGLHQSFGESGAVEADKGMVGAVAALNDGLGDEFLAHAAFAAKDNGGSRAGDGFDGLIDFLHGGTAPNEAVEGGLAFELLEEAAAFEFERALFDGTREDNLEFGIIQRIEEKFVGAGLAGFKRDGAAIGLGEGDNDDIIADFAHFGEDVEAVGGAVADAIEVEEDGVEIGEFEHGFDFVFGGGEGGAELRAKLLTDFGKELVVVGDDGQGIAFRAGGWFGQESEFRR